MRTKRLLLVIAIVPVIGFLPSQIPFLIWYTSHITYWYEDYAHSYSFKYFYIL